MKLPVVSGGSVIKALSKAGFGIVGRKGSHMRIRKIKNGEAVVIVVPDHNELAIGTPRDIIRRSGMARDEFLKLLG